MAKKTQRLRLNYPPEHVTEPILYHLAMDHHLVPNIRQANMEQNRGGFLLLELMGEEADIESGIKFLEQTGIGISVIGLDASGGWDI
ncbi:MAG: NIL domain-containing protein [Chthonomonadales bacterium]